MEDNSKKCSFKEHGNIEANSYCFQCGIYMCNKCEIFHSKLIQHHQSFNLNKDFNDIFTGFCKEKNHNNNILQFYCKNHNELCCAVCLCKIKKDEIGKHKDCDVCTIEEIKDEKINNLKENIKYLEDILDTFEKSINLIKNMNVKINENKEKFKLKIQNIFTKLRNELNNREDKLLLDIDKIYEELFYKDEIIKETEKLPNKLRTSIEKGKLIQIDNKNNLNYLINDCIIIETNMKKIKIIQDNINKANNFENLSLEFYPNEEGINAIINTIKNFGEIKNKYDSYQLLNESAILTKKEEIDLINSWICPEEIKTFKLLYRATRDGDKKEDFHRKADDKSPILILGITPNNYIFGGFTSLTLNYNKIDQYLYDDKAFVFSVNHKKRFFSKDKNKNISKSLDYCIIFGNGSNSLQITNNILTSTEHWSNPNGSYGKNLNLTEGKDFSIKELEVFHIE